jgi:glycosyltransferase involved in cell wall biosynthesis
VVEHRLRVATVIDGLGWGGAEMLLADFAAGAASQDIGLTVAYLQDKDGNPAATRLRDVGIEPVGLDIALLRQRDAVPVLRRHLAHVRPDVVHTHLGYSDLLAGIAARTMGLPSVATLHTMRPDPTGRERAKLALMAGTRRWLTSRVFAVSDAVRTAHLAHGLDRPDHVVTVHNGVVGRSRAGAGHAVRAELGLGVHDVVAVMVTVLRPGKGHAIALHAVARLRREHPEFRLVVLGDGPIKEEIATLARPLGDGVVMTGHRDDVQAVLDAADVLLHPTEVDAFPTALLEAMAASVPVVATAVGGVPEIVEDHRTGLLIPAPPTGDDLVNALGSLVGDPGLRRSLGSRGRQRFESEFTARAWASRTRVQYERVLRDGRDQPRGTGPSSARTRNRFMGMCTSGAKSERRPASG